MYLTKRVLTEEAIWIRMLIFYLLFSYKNLSKDHIDQHFDPVLLRATTLTTLPRQAAEIPAVGKRSYRRGHNDFKNGFVK